MKNIGTDPDPKGSGRRKTTLDTHNVGGGEHSMKMIELMVAAVLVIALGGCAAISTAYRQKKGAGSKPAADPKVTA
jgi:hypothetical protein